jgi:hypothetical protein
MSPTEVGLLILVAILTGTLAVAVTQRRLSWREERRQRIAALQNNIEHLNYLAQNLPAPFQGAEIRQALAATLNLQLSELQQLAPALWSTQRMLGIEQQLEQAPATLALPPGALTLLQDAGNARRIRALLRDLAQLIARQRERHELPVEVAELCLRQIKSGYHRISCDLSIMDAQALESRQRPQVAVHQYRNCLGKLRAIRAQHDTGAQIQNLQAHLARLEQQLSAGEARKD